MAMVDKWLSPEGLMLIECWARDGLNTTQIAAKMGIARKTLWEWRKYHEEIEEAMTKGKEIVDYEVENALLRLALGGEKKTTKTIVGNPDSNGNRQVRVETTVENVLPNATAALAWLNNRKPKDWKRNRDLFELTSDEDSAVTINVVRAGSGIKTQYEVSKKEEQENERLVHKRKAEKQDSNKMEKTGKAKKRNSKSSNCRNNKAGNAKRELDENGWPVDWTPDEEEW